jgi:hypothetical protein
VLLVADDRLLADVVVAAGGHRLVPALVDARPVPRLIGVVLCLAFGRVQALILPLPIVGVHVVTLAVSPSLRPVHFPDTLSLRWRPAPRDAPPRIAGNRC